MLTNLLYYRGDSTPVARKFGDPARARPRLPLAGDLRGSSLLAAVARTDVEGAFQAITAHRDR
jgi:hypothetical protein